MKRDRDLTRTILIELADEPLPNKGFMFFADASHDEEKREYHIDLLIEAGLARIKSQTVNQLGAGGTVYMGRRVLRHLTVSITSAGHDYLEAIRDEGIWSKTKAAVAETGGSATLEIVKSLALGFLKSKIEKHTGLIL